jgi:hypothetical protein
LAKVKDGRVARPGGDAILSVRGAALVNSRGQTLVSVAGGSEQERSLLKAAFLCFC